MDHVDKPDMPVYVERTDSQTQVYVERVDMRVDMRTPPTHNICCCQCKQLQHEARISQNNSRNSSRDYGNIQNDSHPNNKRAFYLDCCAPKWLQALLGKQQNQSDTSEDEYELDARKLSVPSVKRASHSGTECNSIGCEDTHSETSPFLPTGRRHGRRKSSNECNSSVHSNVNGSIVTTTTKQIDIHHHSNNNDDVYTGRDDVSLRAVQLAACLDKGSGAEGVGAVRITQRRCSPIPLIMLDRHTQTKHSKTVTWQCPQCAENSTSATYASYEAIISEAHGLISDMLADSTLAPHVVSGLKAVSNLLTAPENHVTSHKPKVSPLVSLSEASNYGSDSEDLPYIGERPSSLPKRLRKSLPPSLIRRMSTSTWTTTTSATGLPTLETDLCRNRGSSMRHSRDNTPGCSPPDSGSNTPSPGSPAATATSLTIPKSRSFSLANVPSSQGAQKRMSRERHSLQNVCMESNSNGYTREDSGHTREKASPGISPLVKSESDSKDNTPKRGAKDAHYPGLPKRLNMTSDYESSDSPSSSDHSDNVGAGMEEDATDGGKRALPALHKRETRAVKDSHTQVTPSPKIVSSHPPFTQSPLTQPTSQPASQTEASSNKVSDKHKTAENQLSGSLSAQKIGLQTNRADGLPYDLATYEDNQLLEIDSLSQWDFPVFDLAAQAPKTILSLVVHRLFCETRLFETFRIPLPEFMQYFHALELGYREKPYHNRVHATDVLHGVFFLTSQPIPGFRSLQDCDKNQSSSESDSESDRSSAHSRNGSTGSTSVDDGYGIMVTNFPPLELMALFAAAAMHDYDHPGRTNAFLVTTHAQLAVLYNDRAVLECHHAASAWSLLLSDPRFNWLCHLDKGEFKRFRFLVIEAILATDLKRHFELLAEFNAKMNDEDAPGIDWTSESDRLMAANIVIKMADINGPAKRKDLHVRWTDAISEEFYEQGDEEASLGLPISPYMDRKNPQLAKLQESFINHLVAPLCNALGAAGLLPGTYVAPPSETALECSGSSVAENGSAHTDEEQGDEKIFCWLTKHLKDNHDMWVKVLKEEAAQKEEAEKSKADGVVDEMEPIKEEDTPPNSAKEQPKNAQIPSPDKGTSNTTDISSSKGDSTSQTATPAIADSRSEPADQPVKRTVNQRSNSHQFSQAPPITKTTDQKHHSDTNISVRITHPEACKPSQTVQDKPRRLSQDKIVVNEVHRKYSADNIQAHRRPLHDLSSANQALLTKSSSLQTYPAVNQAVNHTPFVTSLQPKQNVLNERRKSDTAHILANRS